jgi:CHRD domain
MKSKLLRLTVTGIGLSVLYAYAPAALAEVQNYTATLNAQSEVPPNSSGGTGTLGATYDTTTHKLTYSVFFDKLTGAPTAAHFHGPAAAGANAGVVVPVKDMSASPLKGEATLTPEQASDLQSGKWYFNIHTAANKGGEIRGQVVKK